MELKAALLLQSPSLTATSRQAGLLQGLPTKDLCLLTTESVSKEDYFSQDNLLPTHRVPWGISAHPCREELGPHTHSL